MSQLGSARLASERAKRDAAAALAASASAAATAAEAARWVAFFRDNDLIPADGEPGPPGERGEPGPPGERGEPGPPGRDGRDGKDGRDGLDGIDGTNGRDGRDGAEGPAGRDGAPGVNGRDGRDGLDLTGSRVVATAILYESSHPLARATGIIETLSDGTTRQLAVKRDSYGRPTSLE